MEIEQSATSGIDRVAPQRDATVDDHDLEERRRGFEDGTAWASDFVTADELRDSVENFQPGSGRFSETDHVLCDFTGEGKWNAVDSSSYFEGPYWEGFVEGAEDVLLQRQPQLNS